nr:protein FAM83A [Pseudochaenichthys georgianus]
MSLPGVRRTGSVLDEPIAELFFQSGSPAGSMKDLVRGFIRKAAMALAIVMDTFSDVELLCDLLEASRKRNVSVHLLLDHLNLNLFLSMWQDLKLDSKHFPVGLLIYLCPSSCLSEPGSIYQNLVRGESTCSTFLEFKLSVRSVEGQTYCARTGRKLTGQVSESFIITDWSEVLTGSYSFSWLSWQVHRTLAVLVRGSAVRPVHQEFLRLHSSSKPIPGFISFITVPLLLPLYQTLQASQNAALKSSTPTAPCHSAPKGKSQNPHTKVKTLVSCNPQSTDLECSKATPQRAGEAPPFSTSQVPSHIELDTPEQHWKTQTCGPPRLPPHRLQDRQTWGLEDISQ